MNILLKNIRSLVTMNDKREVLSNVDLLITGNKIDKIGKDIDVRNINGVRIINASDKVVYPGFINTHHHFYQSLTRNIPLVQNAKLFDWLITLYEIWRELDEDFVELSTKITVGELLLSGCTTSTDHYYVFPGKASDRLIDLEIDTALSMGMRFYANRGSMSRGRSQGGLPPDDVVQTPEAIMEDCERLIGKYHDPAPFAMSRIILAPCSPFSITTELLKETADYARKKKVMMHTHLCETIDEEEFCLKMLGKRPLQYMEECGWTGRDVHFAHGIYFNSDEIRRLAATGTGISHCPSSNLRLGSGICKVPEMLDAGVNVSLSVDGSSSNDSSNYVKEMQLALIIHRIGTSVDAMPPEKVLEIATIGGAKVLNTPEIGSIKPGNAADLAVFNLKKLDYAGAMSDPSSALLICGAGTRTDYTIVNGKILVENGRLLSIDEEDIFEKANKVTEKIIRNAAGKTGLNYYLKK